MAERVEQGGRSAQVALISDRLDIRVLGAILVVALVVAGLFLPPVDLAGRLTALGHSSVPAAQGARIQSDPPGAVLDISAQSALESTRARVELLAGLPSDIPALPSGGSVIGRPARISVKEPLPNSADLYLPIGSDEADLAFVDPYGWDGKRWRWLPVSFAQPGLARIRLPLSQFNPRLVALTQAGAGSTEVSAVLLPPPSVVPAAVAEIPILEMASYHLATSDGELTGGDFPIPARPAGRYAVVDNLEGTRIRSDLVENVLSEPDSRRRHREELVEAVEKGRLAGIVLDYRGVPGDLQPIYASWLGRLRSDLDQAGADLIVTVPMPRRQGATWDSSPISWSALDPQVDALRVQLPNSEPIDIESLDSLLVWALRQVDRRKLQLSVPVQGRDLSTDGDRLISFGSALGEVLDMARSDAPNRLTPGQETVVELPLLREAALVRDPAVGMWRFYTWDDLRQQHTVWLNDAAGLRPAFELASRYRIGRLALQGVEAGLDPALWPMVRAFQRAGASTATDEDYQLSWQLTDEEGRVAREAQQPLEVAEFRFRAPEEEGNYELRVDLVTASGGLVAPGAAKPLVVGPPPPPRPTATPPLFYIEATPASAATRPPPPDEVAINRAPVKAGVVTHDVAPSGEVEKPPDAVVSLPEGVLREGPGIQNDVVSTARQGERLTVLARSENHRWYQVRMEATGVIGWIRDEFLELGIDPATLPVATESAP